MTKDEVLTLVREHLAEELEIDAATIAFGIRNVPDRGAALRPAMLGGPAGTQPLGSPAWRHWC